MRKQVGILTVSCCVLLCSGALARRIAWELKDRPPVSLRLALALAEEALAEEEIDYFCVSAGLARTFTEGDWELHFTSREGKEMWVSVGSDKTVRKSPGGFVGH